jgi:hypothetical protein
MIEEFRRAGAEIRKWRKTEPQKRRTYAVDFQFPIGPPKFPLPMRGDFAHVLYFARYFLQHGGAESKKTRFDGKNRERRPRRGG